MLHIYCVKICQQYDDNCKNSGPTKAEPAQRTTLRMQRRDKDNMIFSNCQITRRTRTDDEGTAPRRRCRLPPIPKSPTSVSFAMQ